MQAEIQLKGSATMQITRNGWVVSQRRRAPFYWVLMQGWEFLRAYIWGHIQTAAAAAANGLFGVVTITSDTRVQRFDHRTGTIWDYGVTSRRVVTDAFVAYIVDALDTAQSLFDDFDYGGFGTGSTAEAAAQTALVTELTTEYASDNVRPTGTISQPAANQYRMTVTLAPDGSCTVAEFSPFNQAATGGGTMMDRSLTGSQALVSGDTLVVVYTLTFTSGG